MENEWIDVEPSTGKEYILVEKSEYEFMKNTQDNLLECKNPKCRCKERKKNEL